MNTFFIGRQIYDCRKKKNYRCVAVFMIRCMIHRKEVCELQEFFSASPQRQAFFISHPKLFMQLTRQFFYLHSHIYERLNLIRSSFSFAESHFTRPALDHIYSLNGSSLLLWSGRLLDEAACIRLFYNSSELREGLLTLGFYIKNRSIYHINFWIENHSGKPVFYIGCHQGSKSGLDINRKITKALYGYRPKNFILFAFRILAAKTGVSQIKAVSNKGFYACNHMRKDRKLKTSYDEFWEECGGRISSDFRFFDLPAEEPRKREEDIPARKRGLYRKRFESMDFFEKEFTGQLDSWIKPIKTV